MIFQDKCRKKISSEAENERVKLQKSFTPSTAIKPKTITKAAQTTITTATTKATKNNGIFFNI